MIGDGTTTTLKLLSHHHFETILQPSIIQWHVGVCGWCCVPALLLLLLLFWNLSHAQKKMKRIISGGPFLCPKCFTHLLEVPFSAVPVFMGVYSLL